MKVVFTKHARMRMNSRGITEEEVKEALRRPNEVRKRHGRHYIRKQLERGTFEICVERTTDIKVITVYWL